MCMFSKFSCEHLTFLFHKFLYMLSISIDANFRLKLKDHGIKDTYLGSGRSYSIPSEAFKKQLARSRFTISILSRVD